MSTTTKKTAQTKASARKTAAAKAGAKKTARACGAPKQAPRKPAAAVPRETRTTLLVVAEGTRFAAAIARSVDEERGGGTDEIMSWLTAVALLHLVDEPEHVAAIVAQATASVAFEKLGSQARAITLRAWALR